MMPGGACRAWHPAGWVFLSYCHVDRALVWAVRDRLQRLGIETWFDQTDSQPTDDPERIRQILRQALLGARQVVVFCSEAALASVWVRAELATAIELFLSTGAPRITLIDLDGALSRQRELILVGSLLESGGSNARAHDYRARAFCLPAER